ncbi:chromosomal replication initiation protein [Mycoplasmoides genitalium M2288]|uniref:chromosomal replication initiator protein DnaA n=1 Tax=Mycoplasmoides genitalium TaxID=2097 RepID=UPI00027B41B3|nr:chromosomal replication initiator protein DnaA [Mycoplasmoides genitalium]AFQ04807.1 chromosomal replication initiation protein [Mycoplasmoides genitalium M2288]
MEQFNAFKSLLKKHYEKTIGFHDKYIKDINRFVFKNNVLLILLENEFARNSLNDNSEIIHLAESLYEGIKSVNFVNEQDFFFNLAKLEENSRDTLYQNSGLSKNYTFQNFVISEGNKRAYEAGVRLAETQDNEFSPLFIYGETGLGKTHLLQAIGNEKFRNFPNARVKYVVSSDFAQEVVDAFYQRDKGIEKLKKNYENLDLVLIDDTQIFGRKEKTLEILFNIFNNLVLNKKQIVLVSDKAPDELIDIDARMISRFKSGLLLKIEKHNLSSLCEILTVKLKEKDPNIQITNEARHDAAQISGNDVRALNGIATKLLFFAKTSKQNLINTENLKEILFEEFEKFHKKSFDPYLLIENVCRRFNVPMDSVLSENRKAELVRVRDVCNYLLRQKYNMQFQQIGKIFKRSHSSVLMAVKRVAKMIENDSSLRNVITSLVI